MIASSSLIYGFAGRTLRHVPQTLKKCAAGN